MSGDDFSAILLSLQVAAAATLLGLPFALLAARALARPPAKRGLGLALLDAAVSLPLVLPPVATGYVLLLLFGRQGPIGAILAKVGVVFAFDWTGAALASAIMAFPLMVRPIRLAIEAIDIEVDEVARTFGAGRLTRFLRLTVPLATPGLIAGAMLGFAKSLGEFGATITFVSNIPGETQTLPSLIYTFTQVPGGDAGAFRLTLVSIAISMMALLGSELLAKRIGARRQTA